MAAGATPSLNAHSDSQRPSHPPRARRVRLEPLGYISLPEGSRVYRDGLHVDVWFGHIELPDGALRIEYTCGMVQTPFDVEKERFVWTKTENLSHTAFKYGLKRGVNGDVMAARIGWLNFTAAIRDDRGRDLFLEIVRSYKKGRCRGCDTPINNSPSK